MALQHQQISTASAGSLSTAAFRRRLVAGGVVLGLCVAGMAAYRMEHARQRGVEVARTAALNLSCVLDHYVAGLVRNGDFALAGTDDTQELMKKADKAMYAAKAAGRNGYRFFVADTA